MALAVTPTPAIPSLGEQRVIQGPGGSLGVWQGAMIARDQHNFTLFGGGGWEVVNTLVLD